MSKNSAKTAGGARKGNAPAPKAAPAGKAPTKAAMTGKSSGRRKG